MTDKLKAILEEMGCEGVYVDKNCIGFRHGSSSIEISGGIEDFEEAILDIDITEGGGS